MLTPSFSMLSKLSRFPGMLGSNSSVMMADRIEVVVIQLADKQQQTMMSVSVKVGFINDQVVNEWTVSYRYSKTFVAYVQVKL